MFPVQRYSLIFIPSVPSARIWQRLALLFFLQVFSGSLCLSASTLAIGQVSVPDPAAPIDQPPIETNVLKPAESNVSTPDRAPLPAVIESRESPKPQPHIALILPLASKSLGVLSEAVKQGFIAGVNADSKEAPPYRLYSIDSEGDALAQAYRKAIAEGAVAVVAGLTRDGAAQIVRESGYLPTLSLNAPAETGLPNQFYFFSLAIDVEARQVAQFAKSTCHRAIIVISSSALTKRIQESFEKQWIQLGGEIAARITFYDANDTAVLRSSVRRAKAECVFLAADAWSARAIRPYLPTGVAVYATSLAYDASASPVTNVDLESVKLLDMPWFVRPDHPAVMIYARKAPVLSVDQGRLYALGIDAWRLIQQVLAHKTAIPPLDGVTGQLTLDGSGHEFMRTLTAVEFRNGKIELLMPSTE